MVTFQNPLSLSYLLLTRPNRLPKETDLVKRGTEREDARESLASHPGSLLRGEPARTPPAASHGVTAIRAEAFTPPPGVLRAPSQPDPRLGGCPALAQKAPMKWESAQLIDNTFHKKNNNNKGDKLLNSRKCAYLHPSQEPKLSEGLGPGGRGPGGLWGLGGGA